MKKTLSLFMVLALTLLTGTTYAETLSLRGAYLQGNSSLKESSLRLDTPSAGYYLGGQVPAGRYPIQFTGAYYLLAPADVPVGSMVGYNLNAGGSAGHFLAGYGRGPLAAGLGWATQSFTVADEDSNSVRFQAAGPAVGTFWNLPLADRLQLGGELHYAPDVTVSAGSAGASMAASRGSILGYEARGALRLLPHFNLEVGYRSSQLNGAQGYSISNNGLFAGAGIIF